MSEIKNVYFHTEFVKLQQLMKLADVVGQGSDAKLLIQDGMVKLNGEVCTMRGKKVYDGDIMEFEGKEYKACQKAE
jgi:ribosome-associated protein